MKLVVAVLGSLAIYCFANNQIEAGVLSLLAIHPSFGFYSLMIVPGILFWEGRYWAGTIPILLMAWILFRGRARTEPWIDSDNE